MYNRPTLCTTGPEIFAVNMQERAQNFTFPQYLGKTNLPRNGTF